MSDSQKHPAFLISAEGKTKEQVKAEAGEALLKFQRERNDDDVRDECVPPAGSDTCRGKAERPATGIGGGPVPLCAVRDRAVLDPGRIER